MVFGLVFGDYKIQMQDDNNIGTFSYNYIKALQYYELKVAQAKSFAFQQKLLLNSYESNYSFEVPIQQLKLGLNVNTVITATAIRIMHLKNCCYCLMTTARPLNPGSLIIVAIVYGEQRTKPHDLGIYNKTKMKIMDPYLIPQENELIPIIFVSHRRAFPINRHQTTPKRTSEELRQQANTFFKAKKYLQAINLYEMALANIYWPDVRQQSVLYSNAAACLFELRLYQSCIMLSDLAILLDPSYNKGYYRKIRSLLELHQFAQITPLLIKISTLINKAQFQLLNQKYTEVISQQSGVFNWSAIINGTCAQGEYFSPKVKLVRVGGDVRVVVQQTIQQFQTILVSRPLIYVQENGRNFKQSFMDFLKQIQNYSLCDEGFQQSVYHLPCECHPLLSQRQASYQQFKGSFKTLPMKQLFSKLQRSVFEERSLQKVEHLNGYGIWKEMFYFQHKCIPNCTTIHINGYLVINALQKLQEGQILSLDLIGEVQPSRRSESMRIKLDQDCGCEMCQGKEFNGEFTSIEELYDEIEMMTNSRRKKQYIWNILEQQWQQKITLHEEDAMQLIYYYIFYVEKQCEWDDLHNLIRARTKYFEKEFQEHIEEVTTRYLSSYLKVGKEDTEKIYKILLKKTFSPQQD